MSFIHRALLFILRKRAKTILLFLILFVIATLELSGLAIRKATLTAQLNVRQALGGVFTLEQNTSDPDKWESQRVGEYGAQSWYNGAPLTEELAETIMEQVEGIRGWNATYTSYVIAADDSGKTLELLESETSDSSMNGLLSGYGDFASTITAYASTNTSFDSYFTGGYLELTAGRHVTAEDTNAVLISEDLAEQNHLQVGDRLILHMSEFKASMLGIDAAQTETEVEIAGLFHATAKSSTMLSNWSMDNSVYTTMNILRRVRPDIQEESYEKLQFYVNDPGELDRIIGQIHSLPEVDPTDFVVRVDSSNIDAVTEPLANMNRLIFVLTGLILAVGMLILYLVLSGRIKERIHESGVLLSLGLSKWNVAAQYLIEVLLIAAVAFSFSVVASKALAQTVGDRLFDSALMRETAEEEAFSGTTADGVTFTESGDYAPQFESRPELTKIEVKVQPAAVIGLYAVGFLVICAAVMLAALPVLRMRPREILTKMS